MAFGPAVKTVLGEANMYTNNRGGDLLKRGMRVFERYKMQRGMIFGAIIVSALLAFEVFNYTTTDFALTDLLGDIRFLGIRWAMILSLAFCGMDFAGIARLFTPEKGRSEKMEVWYLLGAWFLAATMNATLTWWGVSIALLNRQALGNEILGRDQLLTVVPVFVAVLVWLIRILIIGTFSMAGDRLFSQAEESLRNMNAERTPLPRSAPKSAPRPVRMIGDDEDEDFDQRPRPAEAVRPPVAPPAPPVRPVAAPAPVVRPAPKPGYPNNGNGNSGLRPAAPRPSEAAGRSGAERN
jgi:hypothetical protein